MQQVIRFVRTRLCEPARSGITNLGAPHRDFGSPKSFSLTRTVGKAASSIGVAIVGSAQREPASEEACVRGRGARGVKSVSGTNCRAHVIHVGPQGGIGWDANERRCTTRATGTRSNNASAVGCGSSGPDPTQRRRQAHERVISERDSGTRLRRLPHPGAVDAVRWTHPHSCAVSPSPARTGVSGGMCPRAWSPRGEEREWDEL